MHKNQALLYASKEIGGTELPGFESHLPDCLDCMDRVSLARAGEKAAKLSLEDVPPPVLETATESLLRPNAGQSGLISGLFKLILLAAAVAGGYLTLQKSRSVPPPQDSEPVLLGKSTLSMPKKKRQSAPARPLSSVRGAARQGNARRDGLAMPERPLDCSDASSILAFKRYSWSEFGGGLAHNVYTADRYASCICGNAAQTAGRPKAPAANSAARAAPACPDFAVGEVSRERYERYMLDFMKAAKYFHQYMPLSREQAVTLTRCLCGAMPEAAQ